jgi:hypothetical protein
MHGGARINHPGRSLMKVDTIAKTLVVRPLTARRSSSPAPTPPGDAQSGISRSGEHHRTQVTVKFTGTGTNRVATEVSVHEAKS